MRSSSAACSATSACRCAHSANKSSRPWRCDDDDDDDDDDSADDGNADDGSEDCEEDGRRAAEVVEWSDARLLDCESEWPATDGDDGDDDDNAETPPLPLPLAPAFALA